MNDRIIAFLLENTVAFSLLFAGVWLIKKAFGKRLSAFMHYALWGIVILKLILPVSVASEISPWALFARADTGGVATAGGYEAEHVIADDAAPAEPAAALSAEMDADGISPQPGGMGYARGNTARPGANTPARIDWPAIGVAAWLAGAAAVAAWLAISSLKIRRRIAKSGRDLPESAAQAFERCKHTLRIKRNIRAVVQNAMPAPAIMGALRPRLMLPEGIGHSGPEEMEHVLLHELTHYKRGDLAITLLLNALSAIYWFNPLVWLAFRLIRADMETVCDNAVVKVLGRGRRQMYIGTVVRFAGRRNRNKLLAALSFNDAKTAMQARIKGMFMAGRTRPRASIPVIALALVMLFGAFTSGCQPTPEKQAVVGRQEDVLSGLTSVPSDDFKRIETPSHISEVYDEFPYLKITYDADVIVPETNAYPVTEMTKRIFSEEDILSFIDLLVDGDYEMYSSWTLTKDDYLGLLTKAKQYRGTERVTKDILDRLQEIYDKATNDVVNPRISSLSELQEHKRGLNIKTDDNMISSVGFMEGGNYFGYTREEYVEVNAASWMADSMYSKNMDGPFEHFKWRQPGEPDISQEEAYAIALQYKDALGIDLDLYYAEPCSFIKDYVDKTTGWRFTFMRRISNLRAIDDTGGFHTNPNNPPSYASPWGEEKLTISVDKNGLFSLGWGGASELGRTVTGSVKLEDFDTIQERITNQLNYLCATWGEDQGKVLEIKITNIELGVSMLSLEDRTDIGEYIPTWYATYYYKFEDEKDDKWIMQQIMFSAIDGSYVEPRLSNEELMGRMDAGSDSAFAGGEAPED